MNNLNDESLREVGFKLGMRNEIIQFWKGKKIFQEKILLQLVCLFIFSVFVY